MATSALMSLTGGSISTTTLLKAAIIGGLIGEAAASIGEIVADWIDPVVDKCAGTLKGGSATGGGSGASGSSENAPPNQKSSFKCRQQHSGVRHVLRALVLIVMAALAIKFLKLGAPDSPAPLPQLASQRFY